MKKLLLLLALLVALPANAALYDYYQEQGQRLPSVSFRRAIADLAGIKNYSGTANQNVLLESFLRSEGTENANLGANPSDPTSNGYSPVTGYQSNTTQYISASATTIPVASTKDKSGKQIVLANISPSTTVKVYLNLEPGTSKEEPIMCTGLTASSWTGCTRGLPFQSGSEVTSSTIAIAHNAGAVITITNIGQFYNQFVSIDGTQVIYGVKTFNALPLAVTSTPTDPRQLITLYQLQQATSTGGVDASELVKGVSQIATRTEAFAGTSLGSTGARLVLPSSMATGTPTGGIAVPITSSTGKLAQGFLNLAEGFTFTGGVTSTGNLIVTGTTTMATSTMTSSTITQLNLPGKNVNALITNLLFSTTTAGSINFSTASTTLVTTTVQAGTLDTGNIIQIALHVTRFGLNVNTPCYWNLRYGSQTFDVQYDNNNNAFNTNIDGGTAYPISSTSGWMYINLMTNGTTSTASADFFHEFSSSTLAGTTSPFQPKLEKTVTRTINQTIDQSLVLTARMNNSSAGETLVVEKAWVRVLR